jgi:hypothetical protein
MVDYVYRTKNGVKQRADASLSEAERASDTAWSVDPGDSAAAAAPKDPYPEDDKKYGEMPQAEFDKLSPLVKAGALTRRRRYQSAKAAGAAGQAADLKSGQAAK